jgi:hypothetical protein
MVNDSLIDFSWPDALISTPNVRFGGAGDAWRGNDATLVYTRLPWRG